MTLGALSRRRGHMSEHAHAHQGLLPQHLPRRAGTPFSLSPPPPAEDILPEVPADAVSRYALVLRQWEALSRAQAQYDAELAQLRAKGDALQEDWEALAAERQACLTDLQALDLPLDAVITQVWDLLKVQLWALIERGRRDTISEKIPQR